MAMVKKYLAGVVQVDNLVEGIYTVKLKSLSGPFRFFPGQFLHLALDEYDPSSGWPESRCFSMQSSPSEDLIRITFAVKGNFTRRMQRDLTQGRQVNIKLPYGDLFLKPHNKMNTVFIAGGTGITPFLSLFTSQWFQGYTNPRIYLGFRSRHHNIYNDELNLLKTGVTNLSPCDPKIFYEDKTGRLDINQIYLENGPGSDYFISGPPTMIKGFKENLILNGVPASQLLTDDWE